MQAGKMDRHITFQALTVTTDDYGGAVETWADLADAPTVWAQYLPGGGKESFTAAAVYAETEARFRIRWRSDLSPLNRVVYDGKEWDVLAVDEIGRRDGLELKCKARAV